MRQTVQERLWNNVDKTGECWLWQGFVMPDGYGMIRVAGRNIRVHRLSYELAREPIPEGLLVCHHCDTPLCVRPDHLFVGTSLDNIRDMERKGRRRAARGEQNGSRTHPERQVRGSRHGRARLTDEDVLAIRRAITQGAMQRGIAAQYDVSPALITRIKKRLAWAHI